MHIVQINAVNGIRSTGRTVKELDNYIRKKGYKSTIVYSDGESPENGYQVGSSIDKKLHALFSRITGLQGYFSRGSTKKLISFLDRKKPDIVHVRNLHSNFINMPMLFKYLANENIATVITLHDCWFFTGGHTHYIIDEYYDWEKGFEKGKRNKKLLGNKSWFFDQSERIFNDQVKWFSNIPTVAFVGVSKWIKEEAQKSKVTDGSLVETIYNWVDTDVFMPTYSEQLNNSKEFIILGVASGWSNDKGLDKFIELSKNLDENMKIILIGNVDKTFKLPDNIVSIPETDDISELVKYYSAAGVFLNLSLEETFGKVSAESLACGTPVIAIDSTANAEIIGPGCGFVLEKWDVLECINRIQLIKHNGKDTYSENCRKFVIDNFNSNCNLQKHIELYESLLS